jgi:uncharacterized membrane protein
MSDFEKDLREGLRKANGKPDYDLGQEDTLREMLVSTFRGRMKWMSIIAWIYLLAFTGLGVFAAVRFFLVETTREMILYATVFLVAIGIAAAVKMWYWMIMNRNCIQREVKRLEARVAELAGKLGGE